MRDPRRRRRRRRLRGLGTFRWGSWTAQHPNHPRAAITCWCEDRRCRQLKPSERLRRQKAGCTPDFPPRTSRLDIFLIITLVDRYLRAGWWKRLDRQLHSYAGSPVPFVVGAMLTQGITALLGPGGKKARTMVRRLGRRKHPDQVNQLESIEEVSSFCRIGWSVA